MRHLSLAALAVLTLLAGCASSRHDAPACRGDVFALNPVEVAR